MTKEYILKREERGLWYSYPTGNMYELHKNMDTLLNRVEIDSCRQINRCSL